MMINAERWRTDRDGGELVRETSKVRLGAEHRVTVAVYGGEKYQGKRR